MSPVAAVGGVRPRAPRPSHPHVGSLHAPDAELALRNARDLYTRRQKASPSGSCRVGDHRVPPEEKDPFFEPAGDKAYRHPTFYDVPEGVEHL